MGSSETTGSNLLQTDADRQWQSTRERPNRGEYETLGGPENDQITDQVKADSFVSLPGRLRLPFSPATVAQTRQFPSSSASIRALASLESLKTAASVGSLYDIQLDSLSDSDDLDDDDRDTETYSMEDLDLDFGLGEAAPSKESSTASSDTSADDTLVVAAVSANGGKKAPVRSASGRAAALLRARNSARTLVSQFLHERDKNQQTEGALTNLIIEKYERDIAAKKSKAEIEKVIRRTQSKVLIAKYRLYPSTKNVLSGGSRSGSIGAAVGGVSGEPKLNAAGIGTSLHNSCSPRPVLRAHHSPRAKVLLNQAFKEQETEHKQTTAASIGAPAVLKKQLKCKVHPYASPRHASPRCAPHRHDITYAGSRGSGSIFGFGMFTDDNAQGSAPVEAVVAGKPGGTTQGICNTRPAASPLMAIGTAASPSLAAVERCDLEKLLLTQPRLKKQQVGENSPRKAPRPQQQHQHPHQHHQEEEQQQQQQQQQRQQQNQYHRCQHPQHQHEHQQQHQLCATLDLANNLRRTFSDILSLV